MVPTAIAAGLMLGLIIRWWAIPVVTVVWTLIVAVAADANPLGAAALGAANAAVGTTVAVLARRTTARTLRSGSA